MLKYKHMKKWQYYLNFENIWIFFSSLAICGAVTYSLYSLNTLGTALTILASLVLTWTLKLKRKNNNYAKITTKRKDKKLFFSYFVFAINLAVNISVVIILYFHSSNAALISPWTQIPSIFFVLIIISNILIILNFHQKNNNHLKHILFSSYLFLIFSIAAIIYQLGYGFDPHIHYAALKEIIKNGVILPKTPYYLGQYSIIVALQRITNINLNIINIWLLPIGAALSIPFLLSQLHKNRKNNNGAWMSSLILLILGFSPFIITTPQNLSYLFLLATIIFVYKNEKTRLSIISALATFCIHPLAGISAIAITSIHCLQNKKEKNKLIKLFLKPAFYISALVICLNLAIWSISGFNYPSFNNFQLSLTLPAFRNMGPYLLSISYALISNQAWLIIALAAMLIFLKNKIWQDRDTIEKEKAKLISIITLTTLLVYLLSSNFNFPALIAYEQDGYTKRLLIIAMIIALPLFWELFYFLYKKSLLKHKKQQLIIALGITMLLTISLYGSYPRFDKYYNSRGYSTSKGDFEAVILAESLANNENYIVLANQQVSAAALKQFGFQNRYFNTANNEFYFYSIPTGGQLYQYFLGMSYQQANRDTMIQAMNYAQVNKAYLIINHYWWASDKIIAEAKISADRWIKIDNGNNYLFEYSR